MRTCNFYSIFRKTLSAFASFRRLKTEEEASCGPCTTSGLHFEITFLCPHKERERKGTTLGIENLKNQTRAIRSLACFRSKGEPILLCLFFSWDFRIMSFSRIVAEKYFWGLFEFCVSFCSILFIDKKFNILCITGG